jgi:RNA polymerase sigma-70 factor (ECF subfamily)
MRCSDYLDRERTAMSRDELYDDTAVTFGPALERLARSYEFDSEKRRDLLQEIHLALWRSFEQFASQCSLRTWVYRVAHNVAASHVLRRSRANARALVSLEDVEELADTTNTDESIDRRTRVDQLYGLIHQLQPLERQVILLYLEGLDAVSIGEITGISPGNAATKIHRIKKILATRVREGGHDGR